MSGKFIGGVMHGEQLPDDMAPDQRRYAALNFATIAQDCYERAGEDFVFQFSLEGIADEWVSGGALPTTSEIVVRTQGDFSIEIDGKVEKGIQSGTTLSLPVTGPLGRVRLRVEAA